MAEQERRLARVGFFVVFGVAILVGCTTAITSGGGDAAPGEGAAAAATSVPPTLATTTTTTTLPPTTSSTTTTSTTSTTTTTTTTTTTIPANIIPVDPLDEPLAAIGQRSGQETVRVQERLLELGFWLQSTDGEYGITTTQAVMAFEKYMGYEADGVLDERTAAALSSMELRAHGRANSGTLIEVDKAKQLLMFVIDGKTEWILNTSTGDGEPYEEEDQNTPGEIVRGVSITPSGLHRVNREREEGWWEGDLGQIYRPKYFVGGVAVHGSNSIPNYPASHGCVRVSVPAMDWIWEQNLMPMRAPVWVHDGA